MARKITGRVEIRVNQEVLLNKAGASITGVGVSGEPALQRNAVMGDGGIHGYAEEPIVCTCVVTITDTDDLLIDSLARLTDCTIIFAAANGGKQFIMEGAWCNNNMTLTAGEGEIEMVFTGPYWTELKS